MAVKRFGADGVPVNAPVLTAALAPVAPSFESLFESGPVTNLRDAGVFPAGEELPTRPVFFRNATSNGGAFDGSCDSWMNGTVVGGTFLSSEGLNWLSGQTGTRDTTSERLCACWNE